MSCSSIKSKNFSNSEPSNTQLIEKEVLVTIFMTKSTSFKLNINKNINPDEEKVSCENNNLERKPSLVSTIAYFNSRMNLNQNSSITVNSSSYSTIDTTSSGFALRPKRVFTVLNINSSNKMENVVDNKDSKKSYDSELSRLLTPKTSLRKLGSNFCRICHGGKSFAQLLSPCNCKGSIALAHLECLERWLRESGNSHCELCRHHFHIIREPKYSIPKSILVFLTNPGDHYRTELILDTAALMFYTPLTIFTTYLLMLICENYTKITLENEKNVPAHVMIFASIFGMAAIDFTYSSWVLFVIQKYIDAWKNWYRASCKVKIILPNSGIEKIRHRNNLTRSDTERTLINNSSIFSFTSFN